MDIDVWDLERVRIQRLQRLSGTHSFVGFRRKRNAEELVAEEPPTQQPVIEEELILPQPTDALIAAVPQGVPEAAASQDDWKTVVAMSAMLCMICSVDRAAMSVAMGPMGDLFSWNDSTKGVISASFFLGYTFTNLAGGWLATKYNPKAVLVGGAALWSVFALATPAVAGDLPVLLGTRTVMGMGEGLAMPAISNLFAKWVPRSNLSGSLSLAFTGGPVGIIAALLLAPPFLDAFGWESLFVVCGAMGLAWSAVWQPIIPDGPPQLQSQPQSADTPESPPPLDTASLKLSDVPWHGFATNVPVLALLGAHCSSAAGPLIILSWLPMYLATEFGLNPGNSAALSILPWVVNIVCTNAGGYLGDKAIQEHKMDKTLVRKIAQGIASVGPATCLFILAADQGEGHSLVASVALISCALGLGGFQAAGLGSNHQDLAPQWAGILYGATNACASVFGVAGIMGTGLLLDATHSWAQVFGIAAGVYAVGYAGFFAYGSGKQQFD